jgi:hypothetical protein
MLKNKEKERERDKNRSTSVERKQAADSKDSKYGIYVYRNIVTL